MPVETPSPEPLLPPDLQSDQAASSLSPSGASLESDLKPIRSLEAALERCQHLGMRLSRQRRFILELLWQAQEHLSARDIYDRLSRQGKEIGHTSVYQNLEALTEQGIIECVERSDGRLYGNISDSHSHVNCLDTHQILDIHVDLPQELLQWVETKTGTRITDYQINFFGYRQGAAKPMEVALPTRLSTTGDSAGPASAGDTSSSLPTAGSSPAGPPPAGSC